MNRTSKWIVSLLVTGGFILLAMQNCSKVDFQNLQDDADYYKISEQNQFVVGAEPIVIGDGVEADSGASSNSNNSQSAASSDVNSSSESQTQGRGEQQGSDEVSNSDSVDSSLTDGGIGYDVPGSQVVIGDDGEMTILACGMLKVKDVIIDILGIELKVQGGKSYQLNIGSGPADLLDLANGIDFIPDRNLEIQQVRVMMGPENYVVAENGSIYPLSAQSQQSTGLIVLVDGKTNLAKDVTYHLTMDFDPEFRVRQQGNGSCRLHPNVRANID